LSIGTPSLALGFLLGEPLWLYAGIWILAAGLIPFSIAISVSLIKTAAPLVAWPIRQAALALVITLLLGILLAGAFASLWPVSAITELTALHAAWGLIGWVLILIIGVAYQVVPMLQITRPYPRWLTHGLTWILFLGLLLISVATQVESMASFGLLGTLLLSASSIVFASVTLRLQAGRRRKLPDTTLNFWRFGLASLIFSALVFPVLHWLPGRLDGCRRNQPRHRLPAGFRGFGSRRHAVQNRALSGLVSSQDPDTCQGRQHPEHEADDSGQPGADSFPAASGQPGPAVAYTLTANANQPLRQHRRPPSARRKRHPAMAEPAAGETPVPETWRLS
jgi:hypothetical protein